MFEEKLTFRIVLEEKSKIKYDYHNYKISTY